jgi:hypothetical protein
MSEEQDKSSPEEIANEFSEELSELLQKYSIKEYAGVFIVKDLPIISFSPDTIVATRLLKQAHNKCRADVMNRIGE